MSKFENRSARVALVIVGNEVLSGDTHDTNGHYLAHRLSEIGHRLELMLTIQDSFESFEEYVKPLISKFDIIFTSGGIGPTPDDITREAIARIVDCKAVVHEEAMRMLEEFYGDRINDNAKRMAVLPEGCELVMNVQTGAPGFKIGNIYSFAGVPEIFRDMFESVAPTLGGRPAFRRELTTKIGESRFSHVMREACEEFPDVEIGSYPKMSGEYRVKIVLKGYNGQVLDSCLTFLSERITELEKK